MKELLDSLFSGNGFMPHGHCYLWTPGLVWLHVISDAFIVLAYYSIPISLVYFARRRTDINFGWIIHCFAVFILACGTTHLMEICNVWHSLYWLSGSFKALTALVSVPTAILLVRLIPSALALPSPAMLARANAALEQEIQSCRKAEERVHELNSGLEARVAERTVELNEANGELHREIIERKRAEEQLTHFGASVRALSRRLFEVQEEERRHLARELHDEIGQTLTAAKLNLKIIAPEVPGAAAARLEDSIELLDRLLQQVRQLSLDLRPPLLDELGLVPALRWLADQQARRARLCLTFTASVEDMKIDPAVQTACFRVAQEAITNIIRHSRATSVAVELRREADRLWLSMRDDGEGFDPAAVQQKPAQHSRLGLLSMKERALFVQGGLEVHSAPRQGTEIRAWFPLASLETRAGATSA